MKPQSELLEAVQQGQREKVIELLKSGADLRHDNDAALREAVWLQDDSMREILMNRYPDEASREEACDRIDQDMTDMVVRMKKRHRELIARRVIKESYGTPTLEL